MEIVLLLSHFTTCSDTHQPNHYHYFGCCLMPFSLQLMCVCVCVCVCVFCWCVCACVCVCVCCACVCVCVCVCRECVCVCECVYVCHWSVREERTGSRSMKGGGVDKACLLEGVSVSGDWCQVTGDWSGRC